MCLCWGRSALTFGTVSARDPWKTINVFQILIAIPPVCWFGAIAIPLSPLQAGEKGTTYLGRGAMKLQKPILKSLHFRLQLFSVPAQQALVESDELQEGFGSCVVVALLIAQIRPGCLVDACMDECHELAN